MWAIGRFDLGLTDAEFGKLNPALFQALLNRKQEQDKKEFLQTGMIAAAVINFSAGHPEKPVSVMDFVPGHKKQEFDLRDLPPEEQWRRIRNEFMKKEFRRK